MNERAHVEYFDWLRIIAALSVIFMHTAAGPLRAGINTGWHLLNVCTSLAFTAVPLFFMMSGYLLMTSRKTADISVLLRHRLPRLVVPLAGWTVVAVLWQMFLAHTLTPGAIRVQLVAALNGPAMVHFWYLYTLIALYVLSPILYGGIRTLGKSGRVYLFVLAAAVSAHTVLLTVLPDGAATEQQPRQPALQKRARGADRDDGDALPDGEGHAPAPPSAYFGASTGRSSVSAATVTSRDGSRNLSGPSSSSAPMLDTAATTAGMHVRAPRS